MHSKVLFITPVPLHKTMDKHNCMIFLVQAINNKSFVGLAPVHLYELGSDERKTILNLVLTSLVFISNFCCRSLTSSKLAQDTSEMIIWQQRLKLRKPEKNSGTDFWIPDAQNLYSVENSGDLKSDPAKSGNCLVPIPRKLNNSWMAADLSHLLSVDEIKHKYRKQ